MTPSEQLRYLGTQQQNIAQKALCGELADLLVECEMVLTRWMECLEEKYIEGKPPFTTVHVLSAKKSKEQTRATLAKLRAAQEKADEVDAD